MPLPQKVQYRLKARLSALLIGRAVSHPQAWMFASRTTLPQRCVSAFRKRPNSWAEVATGTEPSTRNRSTNAGVLSARCKASFHSPTRGAGVPAGKVMPNQVTASKPAKPCSATVATSGMSGERWAVVMARPLTLPVRTWPSKDAIDEM